MSIRSTVFALASASLMLSAPGAVAQTAPSPAPMAGPMAGPGGGMMAPRTRDELPAFVDRLFTRLDADGDAAVTGAELATLTQGAAGPRGGARLRTMIAQADADSDGRVTRDEIGAGAERMFARMDRDGDGRLADDELPQPPAPPRAPAIPTPSPEPMPMPEMPGG